MVDRSRRHGTDERDFVGDPAGMRKEFRQVHAALAARAELIGGAEDVAGLLVKVDLQLAARVWLPAVFVEGRLVVEQVHLRRPAVLEQTDDGAGAGPMLGGEGWVGCSEAGWPQQMGECEPAQAAGGAGEECAALDGRGAGVHSRYRNEFSA